MARPWNDQPEQDFSLSFDQFNFHPSLLLGLKDMGYREPTPIQLKTIPAIMDGEDVIGVAQTGTGKTAAFMLPILNRLLEGPAQVTRCLIIAPTRELAIQIDEARMGLAYHSSLSGCVVYGGAPVLPQVTALKGGADVVTATPGRLLDHLWHGLPKLDKIEVLVLDEADRMLDMGFMPDIEKILRRLPEGRQNLLFSATMPPEIERLAQQIMNNPVTITVGPKSKPVENVRQELYPVDPADKNRLLVDLLLRDEMDSVLVFTRTKVGADQVTAGLRKNGISCAVIHGNRTQVERVQSLEGFRAGQIRVLVATDIASRGLDVDGISHVVNYDVPRVPEDYVHRVGRTARAGESGHAITLVTREEERDVTAIERLIKFKIPRIISSAGGQSRGRGHGEQRGQKRFSERGESRGGLNPPSRSRGGQNARGRNPTSRGRGGNIRRGS